MVSADAIAGVLGGIGRRRAVSMDFALTEAVRAGLPIAALDRLIANGVIAEHEVETHFIPRRTLYARRQKGTFSREQSDLIVRLARIQAMADDVFGERPSRIRGCADRTAPWTAKSRWHSLIPKKAAGWLRQCLDASHTESSNRCWFGVWQSDAFTRPTEKVRGFTAGGGTALGFPWCMPQRIFRSRCWSNWCTSTRSSCRMLSGHSPSLSRTTQTSKSLRSRSFLPIERRAGGTATTGQPLGGRLD